MTGKRACVGLSRKQGNMRSDLPGQMEIPGTEEKPSGLARIKSAEPLRAPRPQEPCDIGLFADRRQSDLFERRE